MKPKTLLIVVVILAALSAAAWFLNRPTPPPSAADPRLGRPVLDTASADKAARVRIAENGKTVLLSRDGDAGWRVASYHDLPADFSKLASLVKELNSTNVERLVTASPDRIARLEFSDTNITLLDASEKTLLALTLGRHADAGGGRFLRFGDENKAYLARLNVWLDVEPKNWAEASLAKFSSSDIAKVTFDFPGAPVTVTRSDANAAFTAEAAPEGRRLKTATVTSLLGTLSGLRFTETSPVDDPQAAAAREAARIVTLTTFDDKTLTFAIGRQPERTVVREEAIKPDPAALIADIARPAPADVEAEQSGPAAVLGPVTETLPAGPVFAFITHSDASNPVNALMKKRAFRIGDHALNSIPADAGALFEPVPKPAADDNATETAPAS